jgi:hypothetical protein
MISLGQLRTRVEQKRHLTKEETLLLLDVYAAACAWRDDHVSFHAALIVTAPLQRDRKTAERLCKAVDAARNAP